MIEGSMATTGISHRGGQRPFVFALARATLTSSPPATSRFHQRVRVEKAGLPAYRVPRNFSIGIFSAACLKSYIQIAHQRLSA